VTADSSRVLVLAPRGRDGELMQALLNSHGLGADLCTDAQLLLSQLDSSGCAVLTQEALDSGVQVQLARVLAAQPAWSDYPLIAIVNADASEASQVLGVELGNVTVLERPLAPHTLLTAVRAALRGRRRQYEARAAIQQRDQFLAMLGHELRNPLGAIVLAAQLASTDADRSQLASRLALIERQSHVLGRLVDDLLDVARVTTGKVQLRREAVDVDETLRGCIAALAARARGRSISIVVSKTSGAVIEGDRVRLEQVFGNLLANAIKYSPADRRVTVSSALEDGMCVVRVRDQGIGVAPEMHHRVFELFAQADGSLERADGGMGIGLTLVDRLVRLHGGHVELSSKGLGHGAELVVKLPVGNPPVPDDVIPIASRQATNQLRVVLVEDNHDLRELTAELLVALGCSVELAGDGLDGLELIIASRPDIALVDIGLPRLDGFGVAREVRRRVGTAPLLVAVSGYGLEQDREEGRRAGFDRHVTKPLGSEQLRALLQLADETRTLRAETA
jgi:signal transduction histidine kinase/ActR/RegA family two-component response regulator